MARDASASEARRRSGMKVVITGGAGFLGRKLARRLLAKGTLLGPSGKEETIDKLTLFDVVEAPPVAQGDNRLVSLTGDVSDRATMRRIIDADTQSVFHFAA